ncbi:alcohol dehydrogenase cytochrome c protein [Halorhabdus tiamatea SARL4B]|uniref:Alcohol dehydrogenase cytochrome c protein n=1 Tax=Halorhabdus tiamatea SARL4B TaxID=1033806 RepID=U2E0I9_9EURY|nr:PQQ-binding-like beta-propeller repeat protein [Halorhabdus tiamatea]ERJ05873.1 alcohol dehydrogenase cytochrome c protein [Halorhabdus tiamatea SARL4B]
MPSRRSYLAGLGAAAISVAGCASLPFVSPVSERWRTTVGPENTTLNAPLAVGDATIYATDDDGTLWAIDAASGDVRWAERIVDPGDHVSTGPGAGADVVCAGRPPVAFAPGGERLWSATTDALAESLHAAPPVVGSDAVFVRTADGFTAGFDRSDGHRRFRVDLDADEFGVLAAADGRVFTDTDGSLVALDATGGDRLWEQPVSAPDDLAVTDERVLVADSQGGVRAFDIVTGDERWQYDLPEANAVAVAGERAVAVGGSPAVSGQSGPTSHDVPGPLVALDIGSGEKQWRVTLDRFAWFPPAVGSDRVYVSRVAGGVVAYSTSGERVWTHEFGEDAEPITGPVIHDGRLYVGVRDSSEAYVAALAET